MLLDASFLYGKARLMNPSVFLMRQMPHLLDWLGRRRQLHRLNEVDRLAILVRKGSQLPRLQALLETCIRRNWFSAGARLRRRIQLVLRDIELEVSELAGQFARPSGVPLSCDFIFGELRQLSAEFGDVKIDRLACTVTVTTEPITLEGIPLGRFEIRLLVTDMEGGDPARCLRIVALDPNPAACADDVTHPHVQGEHLCTGDATLPMRAAIQDGRICDLLLLVRSVLTTYNADSPFIRLAQWDGRPCADCDHILGDEENHYCDGCDRDYCESCISWCRRCDVSRCRACLGSCAICDESCCYGCLVNCSACGLACCEECLIDGCCNPCLEHQKEEIHEIDTKDEPEAPVATDMAAA